LVILILKLEHIYSNADSLIWISVAEEGLTQHLVQYVKLRNYVVHKCKRRLVIAPYVNQHHNKDLGLTHINLCDYFIFPEDTSCSTDQPKKIVTTFDCAIPCNDTWHCTKIAFIY